MRRKKIVFILLAIIAAEIVCIAGICIRDTQAESKPDVTMRQVGPHAVLYTVYRGHYNRIGPVINQLYEVVDAYGIKTTGPLSTGYLNNPQAISPAHWLIEIRIPVSADAIKQAGTLGRMTDVKLLPAMKVAAAVKPEGHDDPETAIRNLYLWINQHGYRIAGGIWQTVLCDEVEDYTQMRTEFFIPIESCAATKG